MHCTLHNILFFVCLLLLTTKYINAQNYILHPTTISSTWLNDLGAFEPTDFQSVKPPSFKMTAFGRSYSMLASDSGSIHFGDAATLSKRKCCFESCDIYCDLASSIRNVELAAIPLHLPSLPTGTRFTHSIYSNATVYAYRTTMVTDSYTISYSIVLITPSTIIMGLESTTGTLPANFWSTTFSGLVGSQHSTFAPSPINDQTLDDTYEFPNTEGYPPTTLISYHRSQYSIGKVYVYCAIGGASCGQSFITSTTTLPQILYQTTNSDAACFRPHSSSFLTKLLALNNDPITDLKPYPGIACFVTFYSSTYDNLLTTYTIGDYDRITDTFTCTIPTTSSTGQTITLSSYSFLSISITSTQSTTPSRTLPYQPIPTWTPVNYQQDFTTTTNLPLDLDSNINDGSTAQYISISTTPLEPDLFPYPTTPTEFPLSCHCKFIRYRGTAGANPYNFRPFQYGLAIEPQMKLGLFIDTTFNTTITDAFYERNDYCYGDCFNTTQGVASWNNCGQCLTLTQNQVNYPDATTIDQPLNCFGMCEPLTYRNGGYFSYLMHYPIEARQNGLITPNSPYHEIDINDISPESLNGKELPCAVNSTTSAAGVVSGFTTYRSHLSDTLNLISGFKYMVVGLSIIAFGFTIYLIIDLARARARRQRRRDDRRNGTSNTNQPRNRRSGGTNATNNATTGVPNSDDNNNNNNTNDRQSRANSNQSTPNSSNPSTPVQTPTQAQMQDNNNHTTTTTTTTMTGNQNNNNNDDDERESTARQSTTNRRLTQRPVRAPQNQSQSNLNNTTNNNGGNRRSGSQQPRSSSQRGASQSQQRRRPNPNP